MFPTKIRKALIPWRFVPCEATMLVDLAKAAAAVGRPSAPFRGLQDWRYSRGVYDMAAGKAGRVGVNPGSDEPTETTRAGPARLRQAFGLGGQFDARAELESHGARRSLFSSVSLRSFSFS